MLDKETFEIVGILAEFIAKKKKIADFIAV